jgi:hypothetical protein
LRAVPPPDRRTRCEYIRVRSAHALPGVRRSAGPEAARPSAQLSRSTPAKGFDMAGVVAVALSVGGGFVSLDRYVAGGGSGTGVRGCEGD